MRERLRCRTGRGRWWRLKEVLVVAEDGGAHPRRRLLLLRSAAVQWKALTRQQRGSGALFSSSFPTHCTAALIPCEAIAVVAVIFGEVCKRTGQYKSGW